jgi:hypothetical protein
MRADRKTPGRNVCKRIIAPGIWEDADENMHISIPDLLQAFDLEDTPTNRALAEQLIRDELAKQFPTSKVVFRARP